MRKLLSRKTLNKLVETTGYRITKTRDVPPSQPPATTFHSYHYLRHNARRLEHLASLGLPVSGKTVLEIGAGMGDHTHFFIDRECKVLITEGRRENLALLRDRYPGLTVEHLDMLNPQLAGDEKFDIVYCYGLLYHLSNPGPAIEFMASRCKGMLLLETCVSFGDDLEIHLCDEDPEEPSQACHGKGCRPTRPWVFAELRKHFPHVYMTKTQPWHWEFPLDWTVTQPPGLVRCVFIGSREPLSNDVLIKEVPSKQVRH